MATARSRFSEQSFGFLAALAENNDRAWFNAHKSEFRAHVEQPFEALLETLSERLSDLELPLKGGKGTMFRMNRDVRFSQDKSPYKTNVSGLLTPSGTKAETDGVVYAHIAADGGMAAAGFYKLSPKDLGPKRDRIVDEPETFAATIAHLREAGFALSTDDALTAMPRGYEPHAAHPAAWALKLKSLHVSTDIPKAAWLSGEAVDRIEVLARAASPFISFLRTPAA